MTLEQVDSSTVNGHRRGVGQIDAVAGEELEAFVLAGRVSRVGLEHHGDRAEPAAVLVADLGPELEQVRHARAAQRLRRPHDGVAYGSRAHVREESSGVDATLEHGTVEGELRVTGAEVAEERDE